MQPRILIRLVAVSIVTLFVAAACQTEPRTEYVIETTRDVTREVTVVVVVTATPGGVVASPENQNPSPEPENPTEAVSTETLTPTPAPTEVVPTVDPRPTATVNRVIVAERLFEHGRMFYVQPTDQIWVMIENGDANSGPWMVYDDTWDESLPDSDPDLEPPSEDLFQPNRGFGKLWRESEDLQEMLGWATTEEVGHVTQYQYFPGGTVDENGIYRSGPGVHTLNSHFGGTYLFDETTNTWGLAAVQAN